MSWNADRVPWCETCQRQLDHDDIGHEGTCPSCAAQLQAQPQSKIPWHFWVLVVAAGGYLAWRGVQSVQWVIDLVL